MAMNRRHVRRRPLPDMVPFKALDAMILAGQRMTERATPFPMEKLVIIGSMPPPIHIDFANLQGHVGMIGVGETAQVTESQIAVLKRRRDEMIQMVMQSFKYGDDE